MSGVKPSVEKLVALRSGGYCAFPSCQRRLITEATTSNEARVRGQIAHIAGEKPAAARFDSSMDDATRNGADNLIFLCRDHHADIDNQPETYPVHLLTKWKHDHERKVAATLARELAELNFQQLSDVCNDFSRSARGASAHSDFQLTEILEKITKNELLEVEEDIRLGLSRVTVVRAFIESQNRIDAGYSDKLKYGFKARYAQYRHDGLSSVDTYLELVDVARRHTSTRSNAPALAVVSSLFEACDIFET